MGGGAHGLLLADFMDFDFTTVCVGKVIYIMPEVYPSGGGFPNLKWPDPKNPWY